MTCILSQMTFILQPTMLHGMVPHREGMKEFRRIKPPFFFSLSCTLSPLNVSLLLMMALAILDCHQTLMSIDCGRLSNGLIGSIWW